MARIIYVGMDVHKESYTLCCFTPEDEETFYHQTMSADYTMVIKYLDRIKKMQVKQTDGEIIFKCGYEAGSMGYTLFHQLNKNGINCVILAPSSMPVTSNKRIKTDKRDADNIAKCLAFRTYSKVHVPTVDDEAVKEYIRMRTAKKQLLKSTKQQINALVLRHGLRFDGGVKYWTKKHISWLRALKLGGVLAETLSEYLTTYDYLTDKIERLDERIEELAKGDAYQEKVKKLTCLIGVKTLTALSTIVEIGDFNRFANPERLAAFIGLVPGEASSGSKLVRLGITKAGNAQVRKMLVESAQGYTRGSVGYKSAELKRRQSGNSPEVIAYADKANERLRRKFYRMTLRNGTKRNIAATAIARELACFMWGLMTNNIA